MANTVLPLSSDIYLEVDGKKVAVVQSYTTRATRTSREIEAFGDDRGREQVHAGGEPPVRDG